MALGVVENDDAFLEKIFQDGDRGEHGQDHRPGQRSALGFPLDLNSALRQEGTELGIVLLVAFVNVGFHRHSQGTFRSFEGRRLRGSNVLEHPLFSHVGVAPPHGVDDLAVAVHPHVHHNPAAQGSGDREDVMLFHVRQVLDAQLLHEGVEVLQPRRVFGEEGSQGFVPRWNEGGVVDILGADAENDILAGVWHV